MQDVVRDEETLRGAFLEASEWQGPSVAGPTALSSELWNVGDEDPLEPPATSRARAAARAEARGERFIERHPQALAPPIDPWCLME